MFSIDEAYDQRSPMKHMNMTNLNPHIFISQVKTELQTLQQESILQLSFLDCRKSEHGQFYTVTYKRLALHKLINQINYNLIYRYLFASL